MPEHKDLTGSDLHEPKGIELVTTDAKMIYFADGAGSGEWRHHPGSVHGEMVIESNTTAEVTPTAVDASLATDSDYTKIITGWTSGHEELITFNTDELVVSIPGSYEIHFWADILLPSNNQKVGIKYAVNDTAPYSIRKLITNSSSAGDIVNVAGSGVVGPLSASDTISVFIATDLAGDPTVLEGGLFVKLLDQS